MLITLKSFLDNLHVSERELTDIMAGVSFTGVFDPYQIRLRRKARLLGESVSGDALAWTVPPGEIWIIWNASLRNDSRAAKPDVTVYPAGFTPAPTVNAYFRWPCIASTGLPSGANVPGGIVDAAYFPQIIWGGEYIVVKDLAYQAGDVITFNMLYTKVSEDDYI